MKLKEVEKKLNSHKNELHELGVYNLALFGSLARNENKPTSDVDIIIEFDSNRGIFAFIDVKFYLEELLHCNVDLVTKNALHPALKDKILQEAKNVF